MYVCTRGYVRRVRSTHEYTSIKRWVPVAHVCVCKCMCMFFCVFKVLIYNYLGYECICRGMYMYVYDECMYVYMHVCV